MISALKLWNPYYTISLPLVSRVSRWECSVYTKRRCRMMLFLHCHSPACPSSPPHTIIELHSWSIFSSFGHDHSEYLTTKLLRLVDIHYDAILVTYSTPPLEAPLSYCWYGGIPCFKLVLRVLCRHPRSMCFIARWCPFPFEFFLSLEGLITT